MKRKTRRAGKKKTTLKAKISCKKISRKKQNSDLELLEMLIKKIIEKLEKNSCETKVQDALKAIQLKHKLASASKVGTSSGKSHTSDAGKMFWEMIEQIRKEELGKLAFQPREDRMKSKKSRSDIDSKDSVGPADAQPVNRSTNRKGGPG